MKNKYLLSYLRDYYNDPLMNRVLDYFKVDFDYYLYAYGSQFGSYDNKEDGLQFLYSNKKKNRKTQKKEGLFRSLSKRLRHKVYLILSRRINKSTKIVNDSTKHEKKVLFVEHVSIQLRSKFVKNNVKVYCLEEYFENESSDLYKLNQWYNSLYELSFRERLELERYKCLDYYIDVIRNTFSDFDGLFVGNEEYFMCKLFIDAFKSMGIPTYNWCHGIDCTIGVPLRVDYQLVWGNGVKENLVNSGRDKDSIIVAGNIHYLDVPQSSHYRNSLEDVLVLTSATIANIRHVWDYDSFSNWDRSLLLTYIYSVEKVLKSIGLKRARLRLHPINNKLWVEKFIDTDFYSIDWLPLDKSLEKASLAIGPTSSTFVEALRKGVSYLVYEPGDGKKNLIGARLNPPFDGTDDNLKVAFNEAQLSDMIKSNYTCNSEILNKYIIPFDINSFIHTLGKKQS